MEELTFWTNIAVVILGLECFVILIVVVVLNYLLVRLMNGLHGFTEIYARKVQIVTHTVNERTQEYSEKSIQPVLVAKKRSAQIGQSVRTLFGRGRPRPPVA